MSLGGGGGETLTEMAQEIYRRAKCGGKKSHAIADGSGNIQESEMRGKKIACYCILQSQYKCHGVTGYLLVYCYLLFIY